MVESRIVCLFQPWSIQIVPMVPVVSESHSHVLAEFDCLDPLLSALRLDSGRLKVKVSCQTARKYHSNTHLSELKSHET